MDSRAQFEIETKLRQVWRSRYCLIFILPKSEMQAIKMVLVNKLSNSFRGMMKKLQQIDG